MLAKSVNADLLPNAKRQRVSESKREKEREKGRKNNSMAIGVTGINDGSSTFSSVFARAMARANCPRGCSDGQHFFFLRRGTLVDARAIVRYCRESRGITFI